MSKFRSLILIIGLTIIAVAAALLTVLVLYATGTIVTDPIELVYTVSNGTKPYDGTPLTLDENGYKLVSGEILEGHTAQVKIIGSQTNAGESESTLEVKIFDKNGFDVSKQYAVKVNTGKLTVEKQNISVAIPDGQQVVYSGKEVFFNDYELKEGKLAKGHKIAGANTSLMNVGKLPVDVKPVIYDAFDNDVTENYNIDFKAGEVEIIPRTLSIQPKNVSKVYDGTELVATEYEITDGSLAPGQKVDYSIVTTTDGEAMSVECTEGIGLRIKFGKFEIVDEEGKEVEKWRDNYTYSIDTGILKVEKRPITIATATHTFTYDGNAHYDDTVQIFSGTLAPNQVLSLANPTTVTNVRDGVKDNVLDYVIKNADGDRVDGNYEITCINGKLSIAPYEITVYTKSYSKVYDGKPLGDIIGDDNYELKVDLASKFTLTADCDSVVKDRVNVIGETAYTLKNVSISCEGEDGAKDCTENFAITVKEGKYSITKKPATVQSPSATFTFDGNEHYIDDESKCIVDGLIDGHEFEMTSYTKVTYVSDSGLNIIKYNIVSGTEDVKNNYDVKISYGTLTVNKRALTIQSGSQSFEYNGAEHEYKDNYKTLGLLTSHTFTVNNSTKVKDVEGDVPNLFDYSITKDGADVSENYEISFVAGRLTVIQKAVTVTTQGETRVYNNTPLSKEGGTPDGLIGGHKLSRIGDAPSITDVGTLTNEQFFNIVDAADAPVTNNYKITYVYGTLEVTPKPEDITLNTGIGKEYDGIAYTIDDIAAHAFDGATLPQGITAGDFKIVSLSEIKSAGVYYYTAEYIGENENYTLNIKSGKVTVTKKVVDLSYGGDALTMTYSGLNNYYSDDATIIAGLSVGIGTVQSAVLSKTLENITVNSVTVYNGGEDITSSLDINYAQGDIPVTVNQCAFTLTLMPYSNSYYPDPADLPSCVFASGLAAGDSLVIRVDQMYTDGYSYYQVLGYDIVNTNGDSVKDYYAEPDLSVRGKVTIIY